MNDLLRRPESLRRFGASPVLTSTTFGLPDDAMRSLWATEGAFRLMTLVYALSVHVTVLTHYERPHLASALIGVQCIWSGVAAYALFARRSWRPVLVLTDQAVTLALMYSTWIVSTKGWWDHNQSLPTTMWATNAVLCAGMMWGVRAGVGSGLVIGLASLQIGGDLSWLERSPTLPILLSAGFAAGVGSHSVKRAHEQLSAALELRARTAERERLARQVHDGVLQVLALTARQGAQAGGDFARVGALAGEQERALRRLIADGDERPLVAADAERAHATPSERDLRADLLDLAGPHCRVSAGATPVLMPRDTVDEVVAAVRQALDNTQKHAGEGATSFVLLEDLGDDVVVTVRDDGVGMTQTRPAEARTQGRLGVSASIVGRIEALGGSAQLVTEPGDGVEWEFTLPRASASARM